MTPTAYPATPERPVTRAEIEQLRARESEARQIIGTLVLGDKAGLLPTDWTSARCQHCRERGDHAFPFQHTFACVIRRGRAWLKPAPGGDAGLDVRAAKLERLRDDGE